MWLVGLARSGVESSSVSGQGSYARMFMRDRMTTWWKAEEAAVKAAEAGAARIANVWR